MRGPSCGLAQHQLPPRTSIWAGGKEFGPRGSDHQRTALLAEEAHAAIAVPASQKSGARACNGIQSAWPKANPAPAEDTSLRARGATVLSNLEPAPRSGDGGGDNERPLQLICWFKSSAGEKEEEGAVQKAAEKYLNISVSSVT